MESYYLPIYRFSVLIEILPFFDFYHKWKGTVERVWRRLKELWDENEIMFQNAGDVYKLIIDLDDKSKVNQAYWNDHSSVLLLNLERVAMKKKMDWFKYIVELNESNLSLNIIKSFIKSIKLCQEMIVSPINPWNSIFQINIRRISNDTLEEKLFKKTNSLILYDDKNLWKSLKLLHAKRQYLCLVVSKGFISYRISDHPDVIIENNPIVPLYEKFEDEHFKLQLDKLNTAKNIYICSWDKEIICLMSETFNTIQSHIMNIYSPQINSGVDFALWALLQMCTPNSKLSVQNKYKINIDYMYKELNHK